jgi:glycerophosphoryl diester phosphodiesterase
MSTNTNRRGFLGALLSTFLLPGCGGGAPASQEIQDTSSKVPLPVEVSVPPLASRRGKPVYIAHRGAAAMFPEETFAAYDGSLRDGEVLLECDVQSLKDGTVILMHDSSVDRTTNGTGSLANLTIEQLRNFNVDGDSWHGSNFGNQVVPLFSDWVDRYKTKAVLVPEAKDAVSMPAMLRILDDARVSKPHVLLQCFNLEALKLAVAAGYPSCLLETGDGNPSVIYGSGVAWVGVSATATSSQRSSWIASGTPVLVYTVNRRHERDANLALGAQGFFSDDPVYLSAELPLATEDNFSLRTWAPGMFGSVADLDIASRGRFFDNDYWGYESISYGYLGCLQGYLCPVKGKAESGSYEVGVNVKFEAALNNDTTRWASIFVAVDDRPFVDASESTSGFHFLFRKNGRIEIYKKIAGHAAVQLTGASGSVILDGDEVSFRIILSEASVAVVRLAKNGEEQYRAFVADSSPKGGYLQLGRSGLACKFRKLVVF